MGWSGPPGGAQPVGPLVAVQRGEGERGKGERGIERRERAFLGFLIFFLGFLTHGFSYPRKERERKRMKKKVTRE